jgi:hypothetical protein
MVPELRRNETILTGFLPDQSAVFSVLAEVEALGLELLELRQVPRDPATRGSHRRAGASSSPFQCSAEPGPAEERALEEQEAYDRDETGDQHGGEEHPEFRLTLDRRQPDR